jgi:hypothetical protein
MARVHGWPVVPTTATQEKEFTLRGEFNLEDAQALVDLF